MMAVLCYFGWVLSTGHTFSWFWFMFWLFSEAILSFIIFLIILIIVYFDNIIDNINSFLKNLFKKDKE